jgi:hypothetical protein
MGFPDFIMCCMGEFEGIHAKLAYQTTAYLCQRTDWLGWNSAETSTAWVWFATFCLDGIGNHEISGMDTKQNQLNKQQLICTRKTIGADINRWIDAQYGASSQLFPSVLGSIAIRTFKCLNFNFEAFILIFSSIAPFLSRVPS